MPDIPIEQAIFERGPGQTPRLIARSSGFLETWLPLVEHLLVAFGDQPPGRACPWALFAQPLGDTHVAVIQVADRSATNGVTTLTFHALAIARADYRAYVQDPFALAERLRPPWHEHGPTLPSLNMPAQSLPPRTVAQVQQVLKRVKASALREGEDPATVELTADNSESPALLGGVQVLVDGGKLVFVRPAPDPDLIRGLWTLLPNKERSELWPATFAFSNALEFDALVVPHKGDDDYSTYTTEEQAADYPAGRYELGVQAAAEAGDQASLDQLFRRRSTHDTLRLAVIMAIILSIGLLVMRFMNPQPDAPRPTPSPEAKLPWPPEKLERAATAAAVAGNGDPWTSIALVEAQRYRKAERAASAAAIVTAGDPLTSIIQARAAQARYAEIWSKGK